MPAKKQKIPALDLKKSYPRKFLPKSADMAQEKNISAAFSRLMKLKANDKAGAQNWLEAWSEVNAGLGQVWAKIYWDTTRFTTDKKIEAEHNRIAEKILPLWEKLDFEPKGVFLKMKPAFVPKSLLVARKSAQWAHDLYREKNLPLIGRSQIEANEYMKTSGSWQTEFDGKKLTPSQLRPYLESPDRTVRERAWRARTGMHTADYGKLNKLFDKMMKTRGQLAKNADMPNFLLYQYKNYARLSYTPKDTEKFRDAIYRHVVPAANKIMRRRQQMLGLDTIRPWDTAADPDGKSPPKVYTDLADLKRKAVAVLGKIDSDFAECFREMDRRGYLDLENRPGKAPGAYMNDFSEERMSIIFANSVGTSEDFDTLIHEAGHAIHGLLRRSLSYHERSIPTEFAEVASMSLELLARPHWGLVYKQEDLERMRRLQLEKSFSFIPFIAMLDEFQAWLYSEKKAPDAKARADFWVLLEKKYRPYIDWSGVEQQMMQGWQYNHVYTVPLYYIEYGIAQMGAYGVYARSLKDYGAAVRDYKYALSLGGTVGLPELFNAAGVKFVMKNPEIVGQITKAIMKDIGLGN